MVLTPARSGLARSGATRSGYPIAQGVVLPLYALSGVARSGATRSNYHSPHAFVAIAGVQVGHAGVGLSGVMDDTLSLSDSLNATPTTGTCRLWQVVPTEGQDVVITLGSIHNLQREFAGTILRSTLGYLVDELANQYADVALIDYTWGLNTRKVTTRYTSTTVAAIAADLLATYAPGYTLSVAADIGAESIDMITFTDQDLTAALSQLVTRAGGDWVCDAHHHVSLFYEDTSVTNPTILNAVHRSLSNFSVTRDLSQWISRMTVEGGGANASAEIAPGQTILPVEDAAWYQAAGGVVGSGPQRMTYTGRSLGGGGGLVGPGAAPTSAPVAALAAGAGVTDGVHNVAVTFVTASGESLPSPVATITVGLVAAPGSAPAAGTPTGGTGPNPGSHDYAVTFVTASGETTAGPSVTKATTVLAAPTVAPTPGTPTAGGSVDPGNHDYAMSFVTAAGETTPSPISGQVTTTADGGTLTDPSDAPTQNIGGSPPYGGWDGPTDLGYVKYAYTCVSAVGETLPSPRSVDMYNSGAGTMWPIGIPVGPSGTTARKLYRTDVVAGTGSTLKLVTTISGNSPATYADMTEDASLGAAAPGSNTTTITGNRAVPLTGLPIGDPAVTTARRLYRRSGGVGLRHVQDLATAGTTYTDTTANASLGAAAPTTNTATLQRIPLTLPVGGALVTHVRVYGTAAGGSQLKLVDTVTNGTTAYTVTTTDAGLGANVPTVNTATANQIGLTGIPIGAASVTSRKVYVTPAGDTQLKLASTIADNTTSTATISTADGSLGANVPTSDASGLVQPAGQVLAGSTSIVVAGTGPFSAAGGYAVIGNGTQVIRYTSKTGSTLTGIPASGAGAIIASIGFNSTITAAPQITGIPASGPGAIRFTILKGDPVNLFVTVDDLGARAALSALLTTPDVAHDGIIEDTLQDRRLSYTEATARGEAQLALHNTIEVSIRYRSRDINTKAGRTIAVNLGPPFNVIAEFLIQSVTQTFPQTNPPTNPTYDVVASSTRFTFDDWLRMARKAA